MIYFISGHRDITEEEFNNNYKPIIKELSKNKNNFYVIGDYHGVDIMAQNYLVKLGCENNITVYHMHETPMNLNPKITKLIGGFKTDIERDSAMTNISDIDIAFVRNSKWDSGTAQNIMRRHSLNN